MKILHLGLILVTLLSLGNIRTGANQQKENDDPSTKEGLKISLISPKVKFRRSEKIMLHVMLSNITSKNLYLLGSLGWGYNASLLLHVRDAAGKEIDPEGFPDDQTFVDPLDESTFVKLPPRQFIGTSLVSDLKFLNMNKAGKYSIYVEYFSKLPSSGVKQKPFWGNENGAIFSNLVWVEIIP
jgi:hypothetical protein